MPWNMPNNPMYDNAGSNISTRYNCVSEFVVVADSWLTLELALQGNPLPFMVVVRGQLYKLK